MNTQQIALGSAVARNIHKQAWVQTDRRSHEAWAKFGIKKPTASALLHYMCAYMGEQNALVVPQSVLAKILGVSDRTVSTAIADLAADQWIQIVRLGRGKECAYIVNDRVAWDQPRDKLSLSLFSATVVSSADDQDTVEGPPLRRIPVLFANERQLPTGEGSAPDTGADFDLPALRADQSDGQGAP